MDNILALASTQVMPVSLAVIAINEILLWRSFNRIEKQQEQIIERQEKQEEKIAQEQRERFMSDQKLESVITSIRYIEESVRYIRDNMS